MAGSPRGDNMSKLSDEMETPKTDTGPKTEFDEDQEKRVKRHVRTKGPIDTMLGILNDTRQIEASLKLIIKRAARVNKNLARYEAEYKEKS